jgi:pyrroline-5-carboxylate reductase
VLRWWSTAGELLTNLRDNKLKMKAIVLLGGGRITSALAAGLRLAGNVQTIVVYDRHLEKLRALRRESRVEVARDLKSAVERAEMLIIAVRPASVMGLLAEVAGCGASPPRLCISLAAGIPLRNLRARMGPSIHWARAMPSPVCRIGRGLTPVSFDRSVTKAERVRVGRMFEQVGPVFELADRQMDAITATHSPSHGYHALAMLAKAAERAGLDRATAMTAAAHALGDSISYWRQSGESLDELLHEAATPGGIAAATMAAMNEGGYARAVEKGIRAGIRRARMNARR